MGSADLQRLTLEDDSVKGHGLRGLIHRAELNAEVADGYRLS